MGLNVLLLFVMADGGDQLNPLAEVLSNSKTCRAFLLQGVQLLAVNVYSVPSFLPNRFLRSLPINVRQLVNCCEV